MVSVKVYVCVKKPCGKALCLTVKAYVNSAGFMKILISLCSAIFSFHNALQMPHFEIPSSFKLCYYPYKKRPGKFNICISCAFSFLLFPGRDLENEELE